MKKFYKGETVIYDDGLDVFEFVIHDVTNGGAFLHIRNDNENDITLIHIRHCVLKKDYDKLKHRNKCFMMKIN
jgi:hypothetical protein